MAPDKPKITRRQILVDRSFQLSYLRLWLVVGFGLVVVSTLFYLFARQFLGSREIDPLILRVLVGMGVFILLFCILMGTLSVALAHRVAGAAYRLEKSLDRMLGGDLDETIALRKGDYLTRIAERLGQLQGQLREDRRRAEEVHTAMKALRDRLSPSDQAVLDRLMETSGK